MSTDRPGPSRRLGGTLAALVVTGALCWVGARPVGSLPALGPILDPANGVWATVRTAEHPAAAEAPIPGLDGPVEIVYDTRGVPHVFAATRLDAYRALGYVVARDRLFQLEMQARAGGGTLTELAGERALPLDRTTRALGMPHAAERRVAAADMNDPAWRMAAAYAEGVNAYIDALAPRDRPLEYKLLGQAPARWRVLDMVHLLHRMGWTLASSSDELRHLRAAAVVGTDAADALFPAHAPIVEPIQPNGTETPRYEDVTLPPPGPPDADAVALLEGLGGAAAVARTALGLPERRPDAVGSNNWAVAPERTANGHALLAGDPHLELTLPSIWYEAHLVVPDSLDVYGVTIPGLPGIVIGFNRDVAWSFTNTGADVMDYYVETVDDDAAPTRYRLDGAWRDLEMRVEAYRAPDGTVLAEDTLYFTHRGPMRRLGARWISQRWTVLEGDRDFFASDRAATARTVEAFLDTMAQWYTVPAQNMIVADRAGTIGIRSTGRYPRRPDDGRGDVLRDGSASANDWQGWWDVAEYPQAIAPAQGYLASANQEPFDPAQEPRYFGDDWERPWRAMQINGLLRANDTVTADDMRRYHTDPVSRRAAAFLPALRAAARGAEPATPLAGAGALLAAWDGRYVPADTTALLFEAVMREVQARTWDEFDGTAADGGRPPQPNDMLLATLLRDSVSAWWDVAGTPAAETRDDVLRAALAAAYESLTAAHGAPGAAWRWDRHRFATVNHLLRLPGFGRGGIPMQGGNGLLNPSSGNGTHGASWRMVVELGPTVQARAVYPGGQSGNVASERYADRLDTWAAGRLDSLMVPDRPEALTDAARAATLTLTPATDR